MKIDISIDRLLRSNIKSMQPYSSARDEFKLNSSSMVFLDANENPYETSTNRYPDPIQLKLKQKISDIKGQSPKNLLLGNGSDEVLDLIFRAFCEPYTDKVILVPPTYGMYEVLANLNAVKVLKTPLNERFELNVDSILKMQDETTKLLLLCLPNNPTGNSFNTTEVEKLISEFEGLVVLDEAYIDFSAQESWLSRLEEFPNLIITQTLSKAYGLAGIRIGLCFASEYIIKVLNSIKPPYNINSLSQTKALNRLDQMEHVQDEIKSIINQRNWLFQQLNEISFIQHCFASDTNFILVKVDRANYRYVQLLENGIVVRNRSNEYLCDNCLRITVGTQLENIKLIQTLKRLENL